MEENDRTLERKSSNIFQCTLCDYKTCRKGQYARHLTTSKHQHVLNASKMVAIGSAEVETKGDKLFLCVCGKAYKHDSGYYRHKKACSLIKQGDTKEAADIKTSNPVNVITTELIMELIKGNKELKQLILEQHHTIVDQHNTINTLVKNGISNTHNSHNTNITNTNSNNKAFNLQFFLNETCKDAMNIMEFVDSIKLQLSDLEKFGEVSYTEGISSIITANLKALDVTQRPVHCTDQKRETMYIKDENKWEKEDDNKSKLRQVIKRVANKNIRLLPLFREKYPEYKNSSSRVSDKYDKMVVEAMGGAGNNDAEKEDKIIHNISKCTVIEKNIEET